MTLALLRQLRISIQQREERLLYRSPLFVLILSVVYVSQMQALGVDIPIIQSIVSTMQCYLMPDETALRELSEGVIEKLKLLTDAEFAELEFSPD